jgi:hypothetical protein
MKALMSWPPTGHALTGRTVCAQVKRIPNEPHLAKVRQARAERGLPMVFAHHPFEGYRGFRAVPPLRVQGEG